MRKPASIVLLKLLFENGVPYSLALHPTTGAAIEVVEIVGKYDLFIPADSRLRKDWETKDAANGIWERNQLRMSVL